MERTLARAAARSSDATYVNKVARDGCRGRHRRAYEVRASTLTLPPFKIPVGCRSATLAGLEAIGIHGQAHRATGLAPFEARSFENFIQPLTLCLRLYQSGPRHSQCKLDVASYALALQHTRCVTQVFNA